MRALNSPIAIKSKAVLFLITGILASAFLLVDRPTLRTAALLAIAVWSFCRLYYFAFYVMEKYVEPGDRYSGLFDFVRRSLRKPRSGP